MMVNGFATADENGRFAILKQWNQYCYDLKNPKKEVIVVIEPVKESENGFVIDECDDGGDDYDSCDEFVGDGGFVTTQGGLIVHDHHDLVVFNDVLVGGCPKKKPMAMIKSRASSEFVDLESEVEKNLARYEKCLSEMKELEEDDFYERRSKEIELSGLRNSLMCSRLALEEAKVKGIRREIVDAPVVQVYDEPVSRVKLSNQKDAISAKQNLNQICQALRVGIPVYKSVMTGASHDTEIVATCYLWDGRSVTGNPQRTRLKAEQDAAAKAIVVVTPEISVSYNSSNVFSINYKGALQEFCQRKKIVPEYIVESLHSKIHCPEFMCVVKVGGNSFRSGKFGSVKIAQHDAARAALAYLQNVSQVKIPDSALLYDVCLKKYQKEPIYTILSMNDPSQTNRWKMQVVLPNGCVFRNDGFFVSKKSAKEDLAKQSLERGFTIRHKISLKDKLDMMTRNLHRSSKILVEEVKDDQLLLCNVKSEDDENVDKSNEFYFPEEKLDRVEVNFFENDFDDAGDEVLFVPEILSACDEDIDFNGCEDIAEDKVVVLVDKVSAILRANPSLCVREIRILLHKDGLRFVKRDLNIVLNRHFVRSSDKGVVLWRLPDDEPSVDRGGHTVDEEGDDKRT